MFQFLPNSVLQMSTIFLSIIIEALPFVMLGCLISGALHVFLTPERVKKVLPKNKFLSICVGSFLGFFFPSCECGIVPIVHQFVKKDVPTHTAFAFMLTAPIINPIVLFSTYVAFSGATKFVIWRVLGSMIVAWVIGIWLAYFRKESILTEKELAQIKEEQVAHTHEHVDEARSFWKNGWSALTHSIDEFFDTGRYLIFGSLLAAIMQTYIATGALMQLGHSKILAILVMLVIAATLSLCSEADAFIGSSLLSLFGTGPIVAFLVFGPMVDIKNLLMMKRYFKMSFIVQFVLIVALVVTIYAAVV